jgi:hypothetical protein
LHVTKRLTALPSQLRWLLIGAAALVIGVGVAWLLLVPIADWLAHHDLGSTKGWLHETALHNALDRLLTLEAGVLAAGALWFTARNTEQFRATDSASALIRYGESVRTVQALLGHSSSKRTLDVYGHLWPDSDERARQAIEAAFAAPSALCVYSEAGATL